MVLKLLKRLFTTAGIQLQIVGRSEPVWASPDHLDALVFGTLTREGEDYGYLFVLDVGEGYLDQAGASVYGSDWLKTAFVSDPDRWIRKGAVALLEALNDPLRRVHPGARCRGIAIIMGQKRADIALVGDVRVLQYSAAGACRLLQPREEEGALLGSPSPSIRGEVVAPAVGERLVAMTQGIFGCIQGESLAQWMVDATAEELLDKAHEESRNGNNAANRNDRTIALIHFQPRPEEVAGESAAAVGEGNTVASLPAGKILT